MACYALCAYARCSHLLRKRNTVSQAAYVLAAVAACAHTAPLWRAMRFAHTPAVAAYVLAAVAACAHTAFFRIDTII